MILNLFLVPFKQSCVRLVLYPSMNTLGYFILGEFAQYSSFNRYSSFVNVKTMESFPVRQKGPGLYMGIPAPFLASTPS